MILIFHCYFITLVVSDTFTPVETGTITIGTGFKGYRTIKATKVGVAFAFVVFAGPFNTIDGWYTLVCDR